MIANKTIDSSTSVRPFSVAWLARVRRVPGYESVFRLLGCGWFLILALVAVPKVLVLGRATSNADFSSTAWPALVSGLCLALFYMSLCWLFIRRPAPAARSATILPSLTAFVGTYFPWIIVLFAPRAASASQEVASSILLLTGAVLMVAVIFHLGRCFSIVPQARRLVRTGPYAVVRHPLYLAEEVALLGSLLQFFTPATFALFLVHGALQVRRMLFEEDLLRGTFPDYDEYARSTARLIPYVW